MSTSWSLHLNCAWIGENPVDRFGNHIWIFPRLGLILINSIGGKYLGINDWQISPQQFLQSQHPALMHAMFYIFTIFHPSVLYEHILQHSRLEKWFDLNLNNGMFFENAGAMVLSWVWWWFEGSHICWMTSTPVGRSARNLFDVGTQLAIMSRHLPWPRVIICEERRE